MKRTFFSCVCRYSMMALLFLCLITSYGCTGAPPKVTSSPEVPSTEEEGTSTMYSFGSGEAAPLMVKKETVEKKDRYRTVWYGTNRKPAANGVGYTNKRDYKVHYGKLKVFIPKSHQLGSIKSPHWYKARFGIDGLEVDWKAFEPLLDNDFVKDIRKELDRMPHEKIIFVYIHGYKVDFEHAAIRTAQLSEDLSINGIAAFYSWPTKGSVDGYLADEAAIEASEDYLYEFLTFIADKKKEMGADNVHIIAHSMGNRGLLRVLNRLAARVEKIGQQRFGKVFLAAPDVDSDLFKSLAKVYPKISSRTTLYISPKDVAMENTNFIHQNFRVGYPPVTAIEGIDTVSFEGKFDLFHLGHLYYAESIPVLCHLYEKVHEKKPTHEKCRSMRTVERTSDEGKKYIVLFENEKK